MRHEWAQGGQGDVQKLHVDVELPRVSLMTSTKPDFSQCSSRIFERAMLRILAIQGVETAWTNKYTLFLKKGCVFDWLEIRSPVLAEIQRYAHTLAAQPKTGRAPRGIHIRARKPIHEDT